MIGKSTNTPASTPCMANDNAAVHGFRLLKVPLDSNRLSSNIPALLVFTTDTGNSKLAPAIVHDCAAVDSERTVRVSSYAASCLHQLQQQAQFSDSACAAPSAPPLVRSCGAALLFEAAEPSM